MIIVHTDGGARGNPGRAAIGVVIERIQNSQSGGKKEKITEIAKTIGESTNNVAEYRAVVEALEYLNAYFSKNSQKWTESIQIQFFLDSTLVVNQLNGRFKVKEPTLRELLMRVRLLEGDMKRSITYHVIPREQNMRADLLVNRALDASHVS